MNDSIRQSARFSRGFEIRYDEELKCLHEVDALEARGIYLNSHRNSEDNLFEGPAVCIEDLNPEDLEFELRSPPTTSVEVEVSVEGGPTVETLRSDFDADTFSENTANQDLSLTMEDSQKNKNVVMKLKGTDAMSARELPPTGKISPNLSKSSYDGAPQASSPSQNIIDIVEIRAVSPTPQMQSSNVVEQDNWVPQIEDNVGNVNPPIVVPGTGIVKIFAVVSPGLVLTQPSVQRGQVMIKEDQSVSDFDSNVSTEVKIGSENREMATLSTEASTPIEGLQSSVKIKNKVTSVDGSRDIDSLKDISHSDDSSFLNTKLKYMTDRETDDVSDFSEDSSYGILSSPGMKYELDKTTDTKIILAADDKNRADKIVTNDKSSKLTQESCRPIDQNTPTPTHSSFTKSYNPFLLRSVKYNGSPVFDSDISRLLRNEAQSTPSYRRIVKRPKKHTRSRTLNGCSLS